MPSKKRPCTQIALLPLVAGLAGVGVVQVHDQIDVLSQIEFVVLLFVVGSKLGLHPRHIGPVALATCLEHGPSPSPDWSALMRPEGPAPGLRGAARSVRVDIGCAWLGTALFTLLVIAALTVGGVAVGGARCLCAIPPGLVAYARQPESGQVLARSAR